MPIYAVDEHELMQEESTLKEGDAEIQDGTLYLTDKRLIYEKKGKRGLLHATPSKTYMDVPLYELKNVSPTVPMIKVFTKKFLTVEFELDGVHKKYEFQLSDPKKWNDEIVRWISDARRHHDDDAKKQEDESHRKEVELANAKSSKTHIGMAYFGREPRISNSPTVVESNEEENPPEEKKSLRGPDYIPILCETCGSELKPDMKFCPNCGAKVSH
jgi:hypothetical protein